MHNITQPNFKKNQNNKHIIMYFLSQSSFQLFKEQTNRTFLKKAVIEKPKITLENTLIF